MDEEIHKSIKKVAIIDSRFEDEIINPLRDKIVQTGVLGHKIPSFYQMTSILTEGLKDIDLEVDLKIRNSKKRRGRREIVLQI